jgi:hypothetical protein
MATAEHLRQYVGRRVDILAYQAPNPVGLVRPSPALVTQENGSLATTGIQKLAQMVLIELLTVQGSMRYAPEVGTTMIRDLQEGRIRTELELASAFAIAVTSVVTNLAETEEDDTPDDERLETMTLLSANMQPGAARIVFSVTSVAGQSRQLIMPIRTTV